MHIWLKKKKITKLKTIKLQATNLYNHPLILSYVIYCYVLLLCGKDSHEDASLIITNLTSSSLGLPVIYPSYSLTHSLYILTTTAFSNPLL